VIDPIDNQIHRALVTQWNYLNESIARLNGSASIKPADGYLAIRHLETLGETSTFEIRPIVVNVPERANMSTDLFVVVRGILSVDREHFRAQRLIRTLGFATEAGYFRLKGTTLQHVYGAHYDFSEREVGHPVFHVQMKSFEEFAAVIIEQQEFDDVMVVDCMKDVLKTVRLPSAQMDVFSLLLQLVADHLLSSHSSDDEKLKFDDLLTKSKLIQGAASEVGRLQVPPAIHCYRAAHWYPPIP
jgi:hypothetical protein